jgi:hypothetical protein
MIDKANLEEVQGISRFYETMFLERDAQGKIKQVYDRNLNPIDTVMLYRSFLIQSEMDGFFYLAEWIPYPDFHEIAKKRALGLQRGTYKTRDPSTLL